MDNLDSLVENLRTFGITDSKVLEAMLKIDRKKFIPGSLKSDAYEDTALPIGYGATISQPYTVAFMLQELELELGQKILEIGTGSGYNAALISHIIGKKGRLYTLEITPQLVHSSKVKLKKFKNIKVFHKDGSKGLEQYSPFDRIIQTAASDEPQKELIKQLKINGIYLAPIGSPYGQKLIKTIKRKNNLEQYSLGDFIFVPLTH